MRTLVSFTLHSKLRTKHAQNANLEPISPIYGLSVESRLLSKTRPACCVSGDRRS